MSAEKLIRIEINNQEYQVSANNTILTAAKSVGVYIPSLCYYPKLSPVGTCRMCLVEIEGVPKLQTACTTPVREGIKIRTDNERVRKAHCSVLEFLLIQHPLDCPICDQAGECDLQDLTFKYSPPVSRYVEEKRRYEKYSIGAYIERDQNRCVHCTRCVRTMEELLHNFQYGCLWRGDHLEIGTYLKAHIDHEYSGNIIDVCPVGALTDKITRFKERIWNTKPYPAVSKDCSKGCKALVWLKGDKIVRVTARKKDGVIEELICNKCRYESFEPEKWQFESDLQKVGVHA